MLKDCPNCKTKLKVIRTLPVNTGSIEAVHRVHMCRSCSFTRTTQEVELLQVANDLVTTAQVQAFIEAQPDEEEPSDEFGNPV